MKEKFESPYISIIDVHIEDIITTSGLDPDSDDGNFPGHGWGDNNHNHDKDGWHDNGHHKP